MKLQSCVKKNLIIIFTALLLCFNSVYAKPIPTIFGIVEEQNPIILELIESPAIQRLKNIDQSGPDAYYTKEFPLFNRYEHSVGVYALLKKFNVSTNEQIAGLLHDSSHTVFSHLADVIFQKGKDRTKSYQDEIHDWFLTKNNTEKIISKHNLTLNDVSPKNPKFKALEQEYPDLNADRIEYNLHTGLLFADLNKNDIDAILKNLRYKNNKWFFTDKTSAKKIAKLSTYYTKNFWGSERNIAMYAIASTTLQYAFEKDIISKDDFFFGIDQQVVDKLNNCSDKNIKSLVSLMRNIDNYYEIADQSNYDLYQHIKMRGINPLVLHNNKLVRLSSLSKDFYNELEETKKYVKKGVYIKFKNINDQSILNLIKKYTS